MCDPSYVFDSNAGFSTVGLGDILSCMDNQSPEDIRAVAASFGASYGVVPAERWDETDVLYVTEGGRFVLVDFGLQ
jgi:hypothetical protein